MLIGNVKDHILKGKIGELAVKSCKTETIYFTIWTYSYAVWGRWTSIPISFITVRRTKPLRGRLSIPSFLPK